MNCKSLFLLALPTLLWVSGCSVGPADTGYNPTGRKQDIGRYDPIPVDPAWKYDLEPITLNVVKDRLAFPRTAEFPQVSSFEADYDKARRVSELKIYGNAQSEGPYGETVRQSYFVTWQQPGDVRHPKPGPKYDWDIADVQILDMQFAQ